MKTKNIPLSEPPTPSYIYQPIIHKKMFADAGGSNDLPGQFGDAAGPVLGHGHRRISGNLVSWFPGWQLAALKPKRKQGS